MVLCGLEGSGFIIAVGLTLLMAGVLIYYVNSRLRVLQAAIERQGSVLSQLINDMRSHVGGTMGLATPEAQAAGIEFAASQDANAGLIPVSDDESDEDSDDYDSETEDDDDEKVDTPPTVLQNEPAPEVELSIKSIDGLHMIESNTQGPIALEAKISHTPENDSISDDGDSSVISEVGGLIETLNPSTMEAIGTLTVSKIDDANKENDILLHNTEPEESTIKAMRVNQLRDLAMNRKHLQESEAKSMKKPELIQLLLGE